MKVLAAVVTHNRAVLLDRCLNKILDQTRLPDQVLVINNGCTDDTNMVLDRYPCLLYTSPSPRDRSLSRMPSSA